MFIVYLVCSPWADFAFLAHDVFFCLSKSVAARPPCLVECQSSFFKVNNFFILKILHPACHLTYIENKSSRLKALIQYKVCAVLRGKKKKEKKREDLKDINVLT